MKSVFSFLLVFFSIGFIGQNVHASEVLNLSDEVKPITYDVKIDDGTTIYDPSVSPAIYDVVNDYLRTHPKAKLLGDVYVKSAEMGEGNTLDIHFEVKKSKGISKVEIQLTYDYTPNMGGESEGYGYGTYSLNHYQIKGSTQIIRL